MTPEEAAKTVFITYRQLEQLLSVLDKHGVQIQEGYSSPNNMATYNAVLGALREAFAMDPIFLKRVEHLHEMNEEGEAFYKMKADGPVLLGTARAFIDMYMSGEEKKKIGFTPAQ
jgi:hypothetical protein